MTKLEADTKAKADADASKLETDIENSWIKTLVQNYRKRAEAVQAEAKEPKLKQNLNAES
jgi:Skp family chaperone for outer membrane proteins